jgi:hypothetical protein
MQFFKWNPKKKINKEKYLHANNMALNAQILRRQLILKVDDCGPRLQSPRTPGGLITIE